MPKRRKGNKRKLPASEDRPTDASSTPTQAATTTTTPNQKQHAACDLFVVVPRPTPAGLVPLLVRRCEEVGYATIALTAVVYGAPHARDHTADTLLPDHLLLSSGSSLTILRRLHVIIESMLEWSSFVQATALRNGYDLVSVAARTEATFRAACQSHHLLDIVSLEYHHRRDAAADNDDIGYDEHTAPKNTPFLLLTNADLDHLAAGGVAIEVPYAAAVLAQPLRKRWVEVCQRSVVMRFRTQQHARTQPPLIWTSSGPRPDPYPARAGLRAEADVENLARTVLGVPDKNIHSRQACLHAIRHGQNRRQDKASLSKGMIQATTESLATTTASNNDDDHHHKEKPADRPPKQPKLTKAAEKKPNVNNDDDDDGFIAL